MYQFPFVVINVLERDYAYLDEDVNRYLDVFSEIVYCKVFVCRGACMGKYNIRLEGLNPSSA